MKILDCTLRDGGYYTQWDFEDELVNDYFTSLDKLPVDYIEIGYRSTPMKEYHGRFFYTPVYLLEKIRAICGKNLVLILNEKDVRIEHLTSLLGPIRDFVKMIRLAIDPKNLGRALVLAEGVKKMGFEVGFNVMYMSKWRGEKDFLKELGHVNGLADYFYMVDSYGGVFPRDVVEIIGLVREHTQVPLGFHGHNNMELGLINSLTAVENGVEIIDATITGMGRGAGNLKTELLLTVLNSQGRLDLDFNQLAQVVDAFTKLQQHHGWGTNLPYMFSGANSLPQKEVMEWVSKRFFSFNSIIQALENKKNGLEDNRRFPLFEPARHYRIAIIVGGGPSAVALSEPVWRLLEHEPDVCFVYAGTRNAAAYQNLPADHYFCLVGNEGNRMIRVFEDLGHFNGQCVLPPFPRRMGTFVPQEVAGKTCELKGITYTGAVKDSQTALSLQVCIDLKVEEVLVVGYDGYAGFRMDSKEQELLAENEMLFAAARQVGLNIKALAQSKYKSLPVESVYSKLI
jgi:4-hydroxy 2-oxovalerate aldolase